MAGQRRPTNHHYVPQFYLKRWAGSNHAVPVLLRSGQRFATGTRRIGQEEDFYAVTDADGVKSSWVETDLLKPIDTVGSQLFELITAGTWPLAPLPRLQLARFVGLQWMRGRRNRVLVEAVRDSISQVFDGRGLEVPAPPIAPSGKPMTPSEQSIHLLVKDSGMAVPAFANRTWTVIEFPRPVLYTSDEPIALYRFPSSMNDVLGVGPATADMIFLPVAPNLCIVFGTNDGAADRWVAGDDETAARVNELTVGGRWDQLYRHPAGPSFPAAPPKPDGGVRVIGGFAEPGPHSPVTED